MALFSLSPLFLSYVATTFFIDTTTGLLNTTAFTNFLALMTACVYTFGYLNLRRFHVNTHTMPLSSSEAISDETTPLLGSESSAVAALPVDPSVLYLLKDLDFWLLAIFCVLTLGVVSDGLVSVFFC